MVTLNKKESERFIRKMIETERRPITKEEIEMAEGVREIAVMMKENELVKELRNSNYVVKDGCITFKEGSIFTIERLTNILKMSKRLKKGQIMTSIMIDVPVRRKK